MKTASTHCSWVRLLSASVVVLLGFLTIVGSGDDDGTHTDEDTNFGWVEISHYYTQVDGDGNPYASLSGTAFTNSSYSAHKCAGLCCIFCYYDDSYPGVNVTWTNLSSGLTGSATYRYGTATDWVHYWYANIPLIPGNNDIYIYASDPAGNDDSTSISILNLPTPEGIIPDSGDSQITISWLNIQGADSYNIYWAQSPGVTKSNGMIISQVSNPYIHSNLINGQSYYYVITANYSGLESIESEEVSAIAGAPSRPIDVSAAANNSNITITWLNAINATSYNIYWLNEPGVTKADGNLISSVISPYTHSSLEGIPYYYIVTAVNSAGESWESIEVTALPEVPPPAPSGFTVAQRSSLKVVDIEWNPNSIANFKLDRCVAWCISSPGYYEAAECLDPWITIYNGAENSYVDWGVDYRCYRYRVSAWNIFGESPLSEDIGVSLQLP